MSSLNVGYWHTTYWALNYWNPLYWQKYGIAAPTPEPVKVGSFSKQYWRPTPKTYAQAIPVVGTVVYWNREQVPLYEKEE